MDDMHPGYDTAIILPEHEKQQLVSAYIPVVYGCSHACTFCIIPFRRGIERSRPVGDIVREVRSLARQGVKEITLLGQIVDRYGKDIERRAEPGAACCAWCMTWPKRKTSTACAS